MTSPTWTEPMLTGRVTTTSPAEKVGRIEFVRTVWKCNPASRTANARARTANPAPRSRTVRRRDHRVRGREHSRVRGTAQAPMEWATGACSTMRSTSWTDSQVRSRVARSDVLQEVTCSDSCSGHLPPSGASDRLLCPSAPSTNGCASCDWEGQLKPMVGVGNVAVPSPGSKNPAARRPTPVCPEEVRGVASPPRDGFALSGCRRVADVGILAAGG